MGGFPKQTAAGRVPCAKTAAVETMNENASGSNHEVLLIACDQPPTHNMPINISTIMLLLLLVLLLVVVVTTDDDACRRPLVADQRWDRGPLLKSPSLPPTSFPPLSLRRRPISDKTVAAVDETSDASRVRSVEMTAHPTLCRLQNPKRASTT